MPTAIERIRADFEDRESNLEAFDLISGTGTPGEDGNPAMPAPGEEDPGLTVSDGLAIGTFASLGLTGISYGMMRYTATNPIATVLEPMKLIYEKIQIGKAVEAAQEGKGVTKLMEVLPYVGVATKRMNIDAIWDEVNDVLRIMQLNVDRARLAIEPVDNSMDAMHALSTKAFAGFSGLSALGTAATVITATFEGRTVQLLDDFEKEADTLGGKAARMADKAFAEFEVRASDALGDLDAKLLEIERLTKDLPGPDDLVDLISEAEDLFEPITQLTADISGLVGPYEDFLDAAKVIGAPIEGVLQLFENPPKVLPTIIRYDTVTPGFWLTVPDPTLTNPFRTKEVWVPPVKVPVPGFKEIFDPIPRAEVQKIIDLVLKIAGLPQELLEKALAPILRPLQTEIDKILQPIIDKLNPFDDYLDDYRLIEEALVALRDKLSEALDEIEAAAEKVAGIIPDLDPVEEIGTIDPKGMPTYFGTSAGEKMVGLIPENNGGFMNGAILMGNGGADTIIGTNADDLLGGGGGNDTIRAKGGNDVVLGGNGHDFLHGGGGHDVLIGGNGNDRLLGGKGRDKLYGDKGVDVLVGGKGADTFHFRSDRDSGTGRKRDEIRDFERGKDMIHLRKIDADETSSGNQNFEFIGRDRFSDTAGELRYTVNKKKDFAVVSGDTDGDGRADFQIELAGISNLNPGDFIL